MKYVVVQKTGFASYYLTARDTFVPLKKLAEVFESPAAAVGRMSAFMRKQKTTPIVPLDIEKFDAGATGFVRMTPAGHQNCDCSACLPWTY